VETKLREWAKGKVMKRRRLIYDFRRILPIPESYTFLHRLLARNA
jgi:hypothetical protein